jgi:hypothetical protein
MDNFRMVRSERQQPLPMALKLLIFSGFDEVNVSQFVSQFVSRILVDGAAVSVRLRMTAAGGSRHLRLRVAVSTVNRRWTGGLTHIRGSCVPLWRTN